MKQRFKTLYLHAISRSFTWVLLMVGCGSLILIGGKIGLIGIIGFLMCGIQCAYLIAMGK